MARCEHAHFNLHSEMATRQLQMRWTRCLSKIEMRYHGWDRVDKMHKMADPKYSRLEMLADAADEITNMQDARWERTDEMESADEMETPRWKGCASPQTKPGAAVCTPHDHSLFQASHQANAYVKNGFALPVASIHKDTLLQP